MSVNGKYLNQENIIKKVFDETNDSLRISGSIVVPPPIGGATEAKQDDEIAILQQIETNTAGAGSSRLETKQVSVLVDSSITTIPNSGALTLIATTSDITYQVQSIEDIGEYMALCVGASGSEVIIAALPLGGGSVDVNVPAGSRLSVKSLVNNITNGKLIINVIGAS